jgi:hypothetical protein
VAICPDCAVSASKVCELHWRAGNNHHDVFDEWMLLEKAKTSLVHAQAPGHQQPCGACTGVINEIERYQKHHLAE